MRKRFGDAIRETVIQELVKDSWKLAIEAESLAPVADPEVHKLKFEADQPVTFEFLVETKPEVKLDRLGGFTVTRNEESVTDAMVTQQIDHLRQQKAPWIPVEEGKPQDGDLANVAITTKNDAGDDEENTYDIVIGQNQALPALEEVILQLDVGASKDASITFPPDFPDETKRGQVYGHARCSPGGASARHCPRIDGRLRSRNRRFRNGLGPRQIGARRYGKSRSTRSGQSSPP